MKPDPSDNPPPTTHLLSQLWRPALALMIAVALPTPLIAWYAQTQHGVIGVQAALIAALLCLGSSLGALTLIVMYKQTPFGLHAALAGVGLRTGLPLAIGAFLKQADGPLAQAGVFGMIMVYYLLTLLVETILAARLLQPAANVSKAS
ncbi:hypothetical protein [Blastopirellula marina]|uniref:Uncharacterized protein n=1 Tax=Blastopirellula marina DSM 3645 TaxID=314230 RepID=A4A1A8_9BACT|nr:hypothetical protein [Blastopirellula marina]EAQ77460.1 hypothetical protein DSM3645_20097 [Blastopirellula marina DSM 3645]